MNIDDIVINKVGSLRECLKRVREEYRDTPDNLQNITVLDSITLNLQRACESSIDLAMYLVKKRSLGIPQSSRDAFDMLANAGLIVPELANNLKRMVGFRNIAVHEYKRIDNAILQSIITERLQDFEDFISAVKNA